MCKSQQNYSLIKAIVSVFTSCIITLQIYNKLVICQLVDVLLFVKRKPKRGYAVQVCDATKAAKGTKAG